MLSSILPSNASLATSGMPSESVNASEGEGVDFSSVLGSLMDLSETAHPQSPVVDDPSLGLSAEAQITSLLNLANIKPIDENKLGPIVDNNETLKQELNAKLALTLEIPEVAPSLILPLTEADILLPQGIETRHQVPTKTDDQLKISLPIPQAPLDEISETLTSTDKPSTELSKPSDPLDPSSDLRSDISAQKSVSLEAVKPVTPASAPPPQALAQTQVQPEISAIKPASPQDSLIAHRLSDHVAQNIAAMSALIQKRANGQSTRFDMELRPSDMGRVDVRLDIGQDGKIAAHMSFDSPISESEFRGRQDDLRRQLEQAGFKLDDTALSFSSRENEHKQSEQPSTGSQAQRDEDIDATQGQLDLGLEAQILAQSMAHDLTHPYEITTPLMAGGYVSSQEFSGLYGSQRPMSLSYLV
jgi:hypothetical protein